MGPRPPWLTLVKWFPMLMLGDPLLVGGGTPGPVVVPLPQPQRPVGTAPGGGGLQPLSPQQTCRPVGSLPSTGLAAA